MKQDDNKRAVAQAAISYVEPDTVVGVGSGSTVAFFIEALGKLSGQLDGAVSSSEASSELLRAQNIPVLELNDVNEIPIYVDGADEATRHYNLIKGGGGALTREKIIAAASRKFVCIIDESKLVYVLGDFPLPVEVVPMARSFVARQLVRLGGQPELRTGFTTDNGNVILDVRNLRITEPGKLETEINQIPGVVTNGIFAQRPADVLVVGGDTGVTTM